MRPWLKVNDAGIPGISGYDMLNYEFSSSSGAKSVSGSPYSS